MRASAIKGFATLLAGLLAVLAAPASAQLSTTANGPYYATPSWDQKLTTNRFVILANWNSEAVLDRETGLVWERSPDATPRNWDDAQFHCNNRIVGGRHGWRLPGLQDLASLFDPTAPNPKLPAGHPFLNIAGQEYWSATSWAPDPPIGAWVLPFQEGVPAQPVGKGVVLRVWCVRGGQRADH